MNSLLVQSFESRMVEILNHGALAVMISIGHRVGLFDVMARMNPASCQAIADASGLSERYVREWLAAMVTGDVVNYDPEYRLYHLPDEHADRLASSASVNMAQSTQWIGLLGGVEDKVVEAFRDGSGVPYSAYHRFHEVMAAESAQTVVAGLFEHILPLVPNLTTKLHEGIRVMDVGCGRGQALMALAEAYPQSWFVGYDLSAEAILYARAESRRRRLSNIRFEMQDVAELDTRLRYDLITAFDVIHDQAKPMEVLRRIRASLANNGMLLMQDINGSGHLHEDCSHPMGPFLYTISCMHCTSVSLANGGPGLGAMWGREMALQMLGEAGFQNVRVETLPHDAMNFYYLAQ
jgi:2-polyprenyl-3-methyl-5-hydroxy-6-metoxy-1,4-benzoquinol methylase